jgi:hypothetical protein
MDTCSANGQRQRNAFTRYYEKLTMWENKPKTTPQKTLGLLMEPEQMRGPKTINISLTL